MLISKSLADREDAPVIVLFGGNPFRRDEVIHSVKTIGVVSIYGTLSEEEGIKTITELPKVDLVLIGGRYSDVQRVRIRHFVKQNLPNAKISEPGLEYPYENEAIKRDIKLKLKIN